MFDTRRDLSNRVLLAEESVCNCPVDPGGIMRIMFINDM